MPPMFNEERAAQAAAFFLYRAGGRLPLIKLMKLLYLAEREAVRQFGEPIIGDKLVSMPHGPVLSITLELMNGASNYPVGWNRWITDREGHDLALADAGMIRSPEEDLLDLSLDDLEVLKTIWDKFGHWDKWKLRDYTHTGGCPEWQDPQGSSHPIPMERLLQVLEFSSEKICATLEHLQEREQVLQALNAEF